MGDKQVILDKLISRIVEEVHPVKIFLFGSAVTKRISDAGDLDILVVMPDKTNCRKISQHLYKNLKNIGKPFDIIVTTSEILERHRGNIGLIYKTILETGIELYAA